MTLGYLNSFDGTEPGGGLLIGRVFAFRDLTINSIAKKMGLRHTRSSRSAPGRRNTGGSASSSSAAGGRYSSTRCRWPAGPQLVEKHGAEIRTHGAGGMQMLMVFVSDTLSTQSIHFVPQKKLKSILQTHEEKRCSVESIIANCL